MEFHVSLIGRKDLSGEIYRQLRRAIGDGRLLPGNILPPSRELARSLGVSRMTVTLAYERLAGEGFLSARVGAGGAGTYVSKHVASVPRESRKNRPQGMLRPRSLWDSILLSRAFDEPAEFDFRTGLPDASLFPHKEWGRLIAREMQSEAVSAGVYGHPAGHQDCVRPSPVT